MVDEICGRSPPLGVWSTARAVPNSQSTESIPNQYSNDTTHHLPNLAAMVGATSTRRLVGVRVRVRVGVRASASASASARAKIRVKVGARGGCIAPDWIFLPLSNLEFLRFLVCAAWARAPVRGCAEGRAWRTRRSMARAARQWLCAGREQGRSRGERRGSPRQPRRASLPWAPCAPSSPPAIDQHAPISTRRGWRPGDRREVDRAAP